ncbi:nitroreductase family protein [Kitasatospora sp. NBC_01287]|uniref:nitroreductase family protein n=1 Tax=Kitasatospora sp. NBC_01287 TaxID=2903573 RepID=UPI0022558D01|nr:nitroreductase family protein [Kitasatospora sp. NBC_01287]MCX4745736.1 nitroreductase family protein [Kitasatospora sp. NBC_01287]
MGYAHEYAAAVMRRGRVPMEPADFVPDWADRPRKGKYFPGAERFPLPDGVVGPAATVQRGLHGPFGDGGFTLELLGGMLRDSYGLTGRRLAVQANSDLGSLPLATHANYSRGTASGGGLYPLGVHWVCGPSGPLTPGVYHYASGQHAMERLLTGDVSAHVTAALGGFGPPTDQFLVLGVKFWQNAFKYNSFAYHVVAMDLGALLETWRIWAGAHGLRIGAALWFDEERLTRLLGMVPEQEGVFAVVPLRWQDGGRQDGAGPARRPDAGLDVAPGARTDLPDVRVRATEQERSRRVFGFETVQRVHAATLAGATERPAPGVLDAALGAVAAGGGSFRGEDAPGEGERLRLPAPRPLTADVRTALRARRSSFGRFTTAPGLTAEQLATTLAAAATAARLGTDAERPQDPQSPQSPEDIEDPRSPRSTAPARLYVFANQVADVPPGAYRYHPDDGSLTRLHAGAPGAFLQANYFLANYNLEQAGAVVMVAAPIAAVLDAVGDRGLRLVNATVGAVSQACYTATAAAGLACGVALGFDCVSYAEHLALTGSGEVPMLIMMVGQEQRRPADFDHRIA